MVPFIFICIGFINTNALSSDWGPADFYKNSESSPEESEVLDNLTGKERHLALVEYDTNPVKIGMRNLLLFWQKTLSGRDNSRCPFEPTCSQFSKECVHQYGAFYGLLMTGDRLQREYPGMPEVGDYPYVRIGQYLKPHDEPEDNFIFSADNRRWLTRQPWKHELDETLEKTGSEEEFQTIPENDESDVPQAKEKYDEINEE
jgi:putative component of membrane protein insertase Oxa1/YidC/SpoIIIJ protein YidD